MAVPGKLSWLNLKTRMKAILIRNTSAVMKKAIKNIFLLMLMASDLLSTGQELLKAHTEYLSMEK